MSSSNYPAGVTDAHAHFNPPAISASAVECGADEALVIPSFAVKVELTDLREYIGRQVNAGQNGSEILLGIAGRIDRLQERVNILEQEREYECPFSDEIDLEESECARWDCPVCGNERETDNAPEDRDPDEEWDRDR
jgi:hypothetical protein